MRSSMDGKVPLTGAIIQHALAPSVSERSEPIRLDMANIVERGIRRLAERGDYTHRERQNFRNALRVCRLAAVNRSPFALMLELAPRAPLPDALWWVELMRAEIIARAELRLPPSGWLHASEEEANRMGNIAQQEHRERRNRSTLDGLLDAMQTQSLASRLLADASVHEMNRR